MFAFNLYSNEYRFIAGVVLRDKIAPFERMLWRVCRGNVFMRQVEIEEAFEGTYEYMHIHLSRNVIKLFHLNLLQLLYNDKFTNLKIPKLATRFARVFSSLSTKASN